MPFPYLSFSLMTVCLDAKEFQILMKSLNFERLPHISCN